jgi:hypothetical protein
MRSVPRRVMVQFYLRCPRSMHFQSRYCSASFLAAFSIVCSIWVHGYISMLRSFCQMPCGIALARVGINQTAGASEGLKGFSENGASGLNFGEA